MDYELEIKKHRDAIDSLMKQQSKEKIKIIPNLIAVCLKPSTTSRYKILSVENIYDNMLDCTMLDVFKYDENAEISTQSSITLEYPFVIELITQEEFDIFLNEAIEIINKSNKK